GAAVPGRRHRRGAAAREGPQRTGPRRRRRPLLRPQHDDRPRAVRGGRGRARRSRDRTRRPDHVHRARGAARGAHGRRTRLPQAPAAVDAHRTRPAATGRRAGPPRGPAGRGAGRGRDGAARRTRARGARAAQEVGTAMTPTSPATSPPPARGSERAEHPTAVTRVARARGRERRRAVVVTTGLSTALVVVFLASLSVGDFQIGIPDLLAALAGDGLPRIDYVLFDLRLPRAVTGVLVGLAFGLAGSLFQRLLRNPLASPDVLGISAGASAAAVLCIVAFGASGFVVSAGAFTGS